MTRSNAAGNVAPVDFAGLSVPVVSGIQLLAVAEVHSSAMDLVDDTLVVRTHDQQSSGRGDPRRPPGIVDRPVTNLSALEQLEHSVLEEDLDSRPLEGLSIPEPLENSVPEVILERSSRKKLSTLEPLEHSVPEVILERSSRKELSALEPLEHSVQT